MHDPMTVAFQIRRPWPRKANSEAQRARDSRLYARRFWFSGWLPPLVTIWHVDPEVGGDDDSCDWFGSRRSRANGWYPVHHDEYERLAGPAKEAVDFWWYMRGGRLRPWWRHPRWHVHHLRIQVHSLQNLKRWLFSRCAVCGNRFPWGYAPVGPWGGGGPRWFRGEAGVCHHECANRRNRRPA